MRAGLIRFGYVSADNDDEDKDDGEIYMFTASIVSTMHHPADYCRWGVCCLLVRIPHVEQNGAAIRSSS